MNADDGLPDRRYAMNADDVFDLEVDAAVLDLRVGMVEVDLDALADRLDRLEADVARLRRRRWWR
jgi:hypothetical protein